MSFLKATILTVFAIAAMLPSYTLSDSAPSSDVSEVKQVQVTVQPEQPLSPVEYADKYTEQYGVDPTVFKKVMFCESHNDPTVIGDSGRAKNVMQYHRDTFTEDANKMGEDLNYNSYHDQIKVAAWSFAKGESYRRRWTTYRAIMNGGTYTFTSNDGTTYIVHCKL